MHVLQRPVVVPAGGRAARLAATLALVTAVISSSAPLLARAQDRPPVPLAELKLLCRDRDPCRLGAVYPAGETPTGQTLVVAQVALHAEVESELVVEEGSEPGAAADPGASPAAPGGTPSGPAAPHVTDDSDSQRCLPYEYWLLRHGQQGLLDHQLLVTSCADAQADARPEATEEVMIGENLFTHIARGGGDAPWEVERSLQLVPLEHTYERERRTLGHRNHRVDRSADWQRLGGRLRWRVPACGPRKRPDPDVPPVRHTSLYIPLVHLSASLLDTEWSTTLLGRCAATLDGTPEHGFVLEGEVRSDADARLRLLLGSDSVLLVELRDDHWQLRSRDGADDDRLELWLGPVTDYEAKCLGPRPAPVSWSIRVSDGAVTPGQGATGPPPVVRRQAVVVRDGGTKMRLRIALPAPVEALTVVYRDRDPDGGHVLSSSALRPDDVASLGAVRRIRPEQARCVLRRDALQLQLPGATPPDVAALAPLQ